MTAHDSFHEAALFAEAVTGAEGEFRGEWAGLCLVGG